MKSHFISIILALILSFSFTIHAEEQNSKNTNMKNLKEQKKPYTPEDILSEKQDTITIEGVELRKGTIAAALKNADIIEDEQSSKEEVQAAYDSFKACADNLILIGLHKHMIWKNDKIQKIIDDAYAKKNSASEK